MVEYHRDPLIGFAGGEADTNTGALVGVLTVVAAQVTPFHLYVLPVFEYTCPRVGFGGKFSAAMRPGDFFERVLPFVNSRSHRCVNASCLLPT